MLADFVGTKVPAVLVLNMMDVAQRQGITIDINKLSEKARHSGRTNVCDPKKRLSDSVFRN